MLKGLKNIKTKRKARLNKSRLVELTRKLYKVRATSGPPPENGQKYKLLETTGGVEGLKHFYSRLTSPLCLDATLYTEMH